MRTVIKMIAAIALISGTMTLAVMNAAQADPQLSTVVIKGDMDLHARGDKVHQSGRNEVHYKLLPLNLVLDEGYRLVQAWVGTNRDVKACFGMTWSETQFAPATAVQLPDPWSSMASVFASKEGYWVPFKTTRNGGDSWTYLTDGRWYMVFGR